MLTDGLVVLEICLFSRISFQMISDMLYAQHTGRWVSSGHNYRRVSPMTTPGGLKAGGHCKINIELASMCGAKKRIS